MEDNLKEIRPNFSNFFPTRSVEFKHFPCVIYHYFFLWIKSFLLGIPDLTAVRFWCFFKLYNETAYLRLFLAYKTLFQPLLNFFLNCSINPFILSFNTNNNLTLRTDRLKSLIITSRMSMHHLFATRKKKFFQRALFLSVNYLRI